MSKTGIHTFSRKYSRPIDLVVRTVLLLLLVTAPPAILAFEVDTQTRALAWCATLLGFLGLFILAGFQIRNRAFGVLIDERNRYSLSRLQITLWTVLIVATLYVVFLSNILSSEKTTASAAPAESLTRFTQWKNALNVDLDGNLVLLMGFSIASFVVAPVALSLKAEKPSPPEESIARSAQQLERTQELDNRPHAAGKLLVKDSPRDARLADLIRGEDVDNAATVDLPRTQMLIITLVIVIAYAGTVIGCFYQYDGRLIPELPKLSDTLLLLILVSHSGYLAGKLIPSNTTTVGSPEITGRAIQLSQNAVTLVSDIQAKVAAVPDGDISKRTLESIYSMAQAVSAEAASLPGRSSVADFNIEELGRISGRLEMVRSFLASVSGTRPSAAVADAPDTDILRRVQQSLQSKGYAVAVTGIADLATEKAAESELAKAGLQRSQLHPSPYRFYEELLQLI